MVRTVKSVEDQIDIWHGSKSRQTLHKFLGLTEEQYDSWILNNKYLKAGTYTTSMGKYTVKDDIYPLHETKNDTYYVMMDENDNRTIVPVSHINEEIGYSTAYSSAAGSNYTGTDTVGGHGKKLGDKKKKKKSTVIRRGQNDDR